MALSAGQVPTQLKPEHSDLPTFAAPTFYITGRQTLSLRAVLLAIVAAAGALFFVLYALSHSGRGQSKPDDDDDPNQVDTVVLGDPHDAPEPAQPGEHPSSVHPTILVHLPRWGERMGTIPNSPAGLLLYNWLGAFNKASYPALAEALPTVAVAGTTAAQMELRKETGGFSLLSAKEVLPGVIVFRLHDQSPAGIEVLGTLEMRPNSKPAAIESFSLRSVPSPTSSR